MIAQPGIFREGEAAESTDIGAKRADLTRQVLALGKQVLPSAANEEERGEYKLIQDGLAELRLALQETRPFPEVAAEAAKLALASYRRVMKVHPSPDLEHTYAEMFAHTLRTIAQARGLGPDESDIGRRQRELVRGMLS